MPANVHVFDHPLVQHKLTLLRKKETQHQQLPPPARTRSASLMAYEVTRDMPMHDVIEIETPLETMHSAADRRQEARVRLDPARRHRLPRRHARRRARRARRPRRPVPRSRRRWSRSSTTSRCRSGMHERDAIVLDPMLATGNSAVAAVERLKETRPRSIRFVCLLVVPRGHRNFHDRASRRADLHRRRSTAQLNDHGYILPGLGDAGDRIFGTK